MIRKSLGFLVSLALFLSATIAVATPAYASPQTLTPRPINWLAAGDSYSSGQGLPYRSGSCARAEAGSGIPGAWGVQAANTLAASGLVKFSSPPQLVACTGALTQQFFNAYKGKPAEWTPSMGRFDAVTFTFGGDNVGFAPFLEACLGSTAASAAVSAEAAAAGGAAATALAPDGLAAPDGADGARAGAAIAAWLDPPRCPAIAGEINSINEFAKTYKAFLQRVVQNVMNRGGNVVVLGYPNIIEPPNQWKEPDRSIGMTSGLTFGMAVEIRTLAKYLDQVIQSDVVEVNNAGMNGVHLSFVSVEKPTPSLGIQSWSPNLFIGHNLGSSNQWLNGVGVGSKPGYSIADLRKLENPLTVNFSFHPNIPGNNAMAQLVVKSFQHLNWSGLTHSVSPSSTQGDSTTTSSAPAATSRSSSASSPAQSTTSPSTSTQTSTTTASSGSANSKSSSSSGSTAPILNPLPTTPAPSVTALSAPPSSSPLQISQFSARVNGLVTVTGIGFGSQPQYQPFPGGAQSQFAGDSTEVTIRDVTQGWSAGCVGCGVTLSQKYWTSTNLAFGMGTAGFGGGWRFVAGDKVSITLNIGGNTATASTTIPSGTILADRVEPVSPPIGGVQGSGWIASTTGGVSGGSWYCPTTTGTPTCWTKYLNPEKENTPGIGGNYTVRVWVPIGDADATVNYQIVHAGTTSTVAVNQANVSGWVDLGTYWFGDSHRGYVGLTNQNTQTNQSVGVDQIDFVYQGQ
jgi:hypothetical protein